MAPLRKVTLQQLDLLVAFAEHNRGIVTNSCRSGPVVHRQAVKAWETVARTLNACGEGAIKTPDQWKRYWHLLKCRTKTKAADNRRKPSEAGDGHNTLSLAPLSDFEQRIVSILRKVPPKNDPLPEPSEDVDVEERIVSILRKVPPKNEPVPEPSEDVDVEERVVSILREVPTQNEPVPEPSEEVDVEERVVSILREVPTQNEPVLEPSEVSSPTRRPGVVRPAYRMYRDMPRWAYELESRRITSEERTANALESISRSLQELAATQAESARQQAQLVELQARLLLNLEDD